MSASAVKVSPKTDARARSGRGLPLRRGGAFAVGVLLMAASTWLALRQAPRESVDHPPTLVEWFGSPIETNAFRRLPVIEGNLRGVYALPDRRNAWVVGPDELVLHTNDGGRSWTRQSITEEASDPAIETRARARRYNFLPVVLAQESKAIAGGVVLGHCVDETGAVLSGVDITIRDLKTRETIVGESDRRGYFAIDVPIGAYMFTAGRAGVRPINVEVQLVEGAPEWDMGKLVFLLDDVAPFEQTKRFEPEPAPERVLESDPEKSEPAPEPPVPSRAQGPKEPAELHAVQFVDDDVGFAVGSGGTLISTTNGGASWVRGEVEDAERLIALHFIDTGRGWVASRDGNIFFTDTGGRRWRRQYSGDETLSAIDFVDAQTGWALEASGSGMLSTRNGGASWVRVTFPEGAEIASIAFVDRDHGWIVGVGGAIFQTQDAGASWEPQDSGTASDLLDVRFHTTSDGWAVGRDGAIVVTKDQGQYWRSVSTPSVRTLRSVHFANASTGWAVGDDVVLHTFDGGATWHRQARAREREGHWVFSDASRGFVAGSRGETLATDNRGSTWHIRGDSLRPIRSIDVSGATSWWIVEGDPSSETLKRSVDQGKSWQSIDSVGAVPASSFAAIRFLGETSGFALSGNELFETVDGGKSWKRNLSLESADELIELGFTGEASGWIVSASGNVYRSDDGGSSWSRRGGVNAQSILRAEFADRANGTLLDTVGTDGSVLHSTSDGGASWVSASIDSAIYALFVQTQGRRWAVGANGTILVSRDEGSSWTKSVSGVVEDLSSIHFVDEDLGFVTGVNDTFLATRDGGETWEDAAPYRRAPAPWFYGSLMLAGVVFLVPAFKKPATAAEHESSVADVFVSDKPVASVSADRLAFNELASGLFRFLRNENTTPPMTIAVTGAWGTGKSSLMNLLRSQLSRFGFRPVWFNAWHHQKGNQLLAGLLENIRLQAVPAWWRPDGLAFRMRLLFIRGWRHCLPVLFMLLVFSVSAGYILAQGPHEVENDLRALVARWVAMFSTSSAPVDAASSHFLPFLISSLTLLATTWKGLTAFSAAPGKLVASLTAGLRMKGVEVAPESRHQFAQEFQDVTEAFAPRRMVIFIDDLDRCAPENVLETLEAVNFLVSSGDCFVVVGMATEQVEHCVGVALEKRGQTPDTDETAQGDRGYARFYMEKLINIEVRVPTLTSDQSGVLLSPEQPSLETRWDGRRGSLLSSWVTPAVRRWVPALTLLGVGVTGFWWGTSREAPTVVVASAPVQARSLDPAPARTPSTAEGEDAGLGFNEVRAASFLPGAEPEATSWRLPVLGAAVLLLVGLWKLFQPPAITIQDSPAFAAALRFWSPLVYASRPTPRGIKRYLNRVRYYEMLQRPASAFTSRWGQLLHWLKGPVEVERDDSIPEDVLVALAAVELIRPEALREELLWNDFARFLREELVKGGALPADLDDHLDSVVAGWPALDDYRDSFSRLTLGVHIG